MDAIEKVLGESATVFIVGVLVLAAITATILKYLEEGKGLKLTSTIKELSELRKKLEKQAQDFPLNKSDINQIIKEIDALKTSQSPITNEQRDEIVISIKEKITNDTAHEIFSQIEKKIEEDYIESNEKNFINDSFNDTTNRLKEELFSLSKRGNLNLTIGIITTILGLSLLGMFVLSTAIPLQPELTNQFMYEFIPRISLVILIEIFAYFFLKLYKENLAEIKYFQNEITTIEMKQQALNIASRIADKDAMNKVVNNLVSTERNFILSKGQSTVDIERAKIEQQNSDTLIGKVTDVIKGKSK